MAVEKSQNKTDQREVDNSGTTITNRYMLSAVLLFLLGLLFKNHTSLQLLIPDLPPVTAYMTYGRLVQASRTLLWNGWLPLAGFGFTFYVLSQITGGEIRYRRLAKVALIAIAFGTFASAGDLVGGLSTGILGQEGPIWTRGITAIGYLLAVVVVTSTARQGADRLGPSGWYLTAASWWLTATALVGLAPLMGGSAGLIQAAFVYAGAHRLFVVTLIVGLLYFSFSKISGTDPREPRPLAALGFWSLSLTWSFMGGVNLVYSVTPDWYETLTVALAISTLVPALAISTDLGLMLKGRIQGIGDRATLRYGVISGLSLLGVTVVNLLLAWRATGAVVGYTTWNTGLDLLLILGGGSFAIFAINNLRRGGNAPGSILHFRLSVLGVTGATIGLLAGGVVTGFSWIAGPSSQLFENVGPGYEVTVASMKPFLWISSISIALYFVAQILYLVRIRATSDTELNVPETSLDYDLEFEGDTQNLTWRELVLGATAIWLIAAVFTVVLPVLDTTDTDATIRADRFRTYAAGSNELLGRDLYISEGCAECHTQSVRPVITDLGLGAVSIAGDYAHENPTVLLGTRFGPDLMNFSERNEFFDKVIIGAHIKNPRSVVKWSTMPPYSYLSNEEIGAIVSYLETLR